MQKIKKSLNLLKTLDIHLKKMYNIRELKEVKRIDLIKKELKNKYPNCRIKLEILMKTSKSIIYHYIINSKQERRYKNENSRSY